MKTTLARASVVWVTWLGFADVLTILTLSTANALSINPTLTTALALRALCTFAAVALAHKGRPTVAATVVTLRAAGVFLAPWDWFDIAIPTRVISLTAAVVLWHATCRTHRGGGSSGMIASTNTSAINR